jgi:hypothetical protein
MKIRYVKREDIDKIKWNSCVHYATNGNIFGYIWYLDHIAKDWDALVEGDYESVMPLIWKEGLFKRKELYQPSLMRESGIYSIHILSSSRINRFLAAIPSQFNKIEMHVNEQNRPPELDAFQIKDKLNYQLFLNAPYEDIANQFSSSLLKKLQIAEDEGIMLTSSAKPEKIADLFLRYHPNGNQKDYHGLQRVMYNVLHRGWGFSSTAVNTNGDILAANFFVYSHKKVMSLVPVETPEGKQYGALAYLMNGLIRTHANKPQILDFNGEAIAQLAQEFGARSNAYYQLKMNSRTLGIF